MMNRSNLLSILLLGALIALAGCGDENEAGCCISGGTTGPACSATPLAPEAAVRDNIVGDGLGNITATDTTPGAIGWSWSLPLCTPSSSSRQTRTAVCPLGQLDWSLTIFDAGGCPHSTSGNTPIS